jgi:tetratricopeptide (TPR) repeat protein
LALNRLGVALAEAGFSAKAVVVFAAANQTGALTWTETFQQNWALRELVSNLAQSQSWDKARQIADSIPDASDRAKALGTLAVALAQAGRERASLTAFVAARHSAHSIDTPAERIRALSALAAALTQVGDTAQASVVFAEAHQAASATRDGRQQTEALGALASALVQARDTTQANVVFAEARQVASAIPHASSRAETLISLASALAQAEDTAESIAVFTAARQVIDLYLDQRQQTQRLQDLAAVLIRARRWDEAHVASLAIPDDKQRTKALKSLAEALAQSNILPQATAHLTDLWRRAQTRDDLLHLFVIPPELLRAYPELGQAFLDSFAWVDAQLAAG